MSNFIGMTVLELAEFYAEENNLIASEQELSEKFDEEIAPLVIAHYGEDDVIAMSEEFNNWTDMLCNNGELHETQYNSYTYVGKYDDE